ncbi:putative deacetylase LmbE-like domain-containing protein, partial [Gaertneriomyces semiglobifer]
SVLLVIAHPDDECMFFAPTILGLKGAQVSVLCLSNGNKDGLGSRRQKELVESCRVLGVHSSSVTCLNLPELQDGSERWWKAPVISDVLMSHLKNRKVDVIVTFDIGGVSGHPNHRATYEGIRYFKNLPASTQPNPPKCFALKTVPTLRKYTSIGDILITLFLYRLRGMQASGAVFMATPIQVLKARSAMKKHQSQMVWFRRLYVVFSRYMVVNE